MKGAELLDDVVLRVARDLKRLVHDLDLVVADRARAELDAVADDVVLVCLDRQRILGVESLKPALRHREGVVREDDLARLGILLEEREVDDPAEAVDIVLADVIRHVVRDVGAHQPREAVALVDVGGHEKERVGRFHAGDLLHLLELVDREELSNRALKLTFLSPADVAKTLASVLLDERLALVEPSARLNADDSLYEKALDEAAVLDARRKRLEVGLREEVGHVDPLERVPEVRLVGTVRHHRVAVLDARPWRLGAFPS